MLFCPKCGSLLKSKATNNKLISFCSCGYESVLDRPQVAVEVVRVKEVDVKPREVNPLATEDNVCRKCGFGKALLVESQIFLEDDASCCPSDRPAYVCGKCGFKEFI